LSFGVVPRTVMAIAVICSFPRWLVSFAPPRTGEPLSILELQQETPPAPPSPDQEKKESAPESDKQTQGPAAPRRPPDNPTQQAWDLIDKAVHSDKTSERAIVISSLSLLPQNARAVKLAEAALLDDKPEVRAAAAETLGELHYKSSIPKLRSMLEDKEPAVVLATAHALLLMHDEAAYEVYYEILTGERKVSKGLIASQTSILHDPKKLAKLGIEEGISNAVPFGGFGIEAYRLMSNNKGARVRAAAAKELADDPDPASTKALINAAGDSDWTVRASAIESLAKRADPSALETVELYMYDDKSEVKYNAATATLRLLAIQGAREPGKRPERKKRGKRSPDASK
jgi:HEAT repeat protein